MTNAANRSIVMVMLAGLALPAAAKPPEDWNGIQCGSDIAKALVGRKLHDAPVAETEKKYAPLGLKDLGADEVTEGLNIVAWQVCGAVVLVLTTGTLVKDALALPVSANKSPPLLSDCTLSGKKLEHVLPLFKSGDDGKAGAVEQAWAVNLTTQKFVVQETAGLLCHRD